MKKLLFIIFVLVGFTAFAQTTEAEEDLKKQKKDTVEGWKTGGVIGLNFSQVSLSNWSAGGENSMSINGLISLFANYKKGSSTWDNSLDLGYGIIKQGDAEFIKSDDKLAFTSKYGQKAYKNLYYAALVNLKTQMAPGYNYPNDSVKVSDFMAPGYLLGAIGMDYKPNDKLTLFVSPLTLKTTFVNNQTLANAGAFGVEPAEYDSLGNVIKEGERIRSEFGGYLRLMYKTEIAKNISFQTNLDLFSNYSENPDHIDINWENLVAFKVNKYISATITTTLIYDHDIDIQIDNNDDGIIDKIGPRTQFKEVLAIGFNYKF